MKEQWMVTAGLDVGTSTTKFILSRLRISEQGNPFTVSRYEIVERKVVYESPIYLLR